MAEPTPEHGYAAHAADRIVALPDAVVTLHGEYRASTYLSAAERTFAAIEGRRRD